MTQTASLYEQFNPFTTVAKLRFVDWFSGDVINSFLWDLYFSGSAGVVSMFDGLDGGVNVATSASTVNRQGINFGDGTHNVFDEDTAVCISVVEKIDTTCQLAVGFTNDDSIFTANHTACYIDDSGFGARKGLITMDGTTFTGTDSPIDRNLEKTQLKMTCDPTTIALDINHINYINKTTNLPTSAMAPNISVLSRSAGVKNSRSTYYEAFNR